MKEDKGIFAIIFEFLFGPPIAEMRAEKKRCKRSREYFDDDEYEGRRAVSNGQIVPGDHRIHTSLDIRIDPW